MAASVAGELPFIVVGLLLLGFVDTGVGCATGTGAHGSAADCTADGVAVGVPIGVPVGVAVPILFPQDALLCPAHLHLWHLITVPTLDIFVAFGCS